MKDMIHRSRTVCVQLLSGFLMLAVLVTTGCRLFHKKNAAATEPAPQAAAPKPAPAPATTASTSTPAATTAVPAEAATISDDEIRSIVSRVAKHQLRLQPLSD